MGAIIGQTITYALEDAIKRQEQINQIVLRTSSDDQIKMMLNEQAELLLKMLTLCERVY